MKLRWNRLMPGMYRSDAFDKDMQRVPYRYTIRRVEPTGWWQLLVEDVHHSAAESLVAVKAAADTHRREAALLR